MHIPAPYESMLILCLQEYEQTQIFNTKLISYMLNCFEEYSLRYGSGHETAAVLLPGFAIKW